MMSRIAKKDVSKAVLAYFSEHLTAKSDRTLRSAVESADAADLWRLWRERVRARAELIRPAEILDALDSAPCVEPGTDNALEFYRAILETARHIGSLPAELWLEQIREIPRVLRSVSGTLRLEDSPVTHQTLLGEIPLVLGALYPELDVFAACSAYGKRNLLDGLSEIPDAFGFPEPRFLPKLRALLACWVRAQRLADRIGLPLFGGSARKRLEWTILAVARLTRPDGDAVFSDEGELENGVYDEKRRKKETRAFLAGMNAAAELDRDAPDVDALAVAFSRLIKKDGVRSTEYFGGRRAETITSDDTPESFCFSEDSSLAVFRSGWDSDAAALFAGNFPADERYGAALSATRLELFASGVPLLAGAWRTAVLADGRKLDSIAPWESVCEETDGERLYWELSRKLEKGRSLERHLLFVPKEDLLILADSVVCRPSGSENAPEAFKRLETRSFFPTAKNVSLCGEAESNELLLKSGAKAVARILPISLPEWKSDESRGETAVVLDGFALHQSGEGEGLFTAVCFDLSPQRMKRKFTWRRLTVGAQMTEVADGDAVGFRIHLGADQYLLYRSLAEPSLRSVFGAHLDQDFVFGKFDPAEGLTTILEIIPDE